MYVSRIGRQLATGDTPVRMLPVVRIDGVELLKISVIERPAKRFPEVIVATLTVPVRNTTSCASGIVTVAAVGIVICEAAPM